MRTIATRPRTARFLPPALLAMTLGACASYAPPSFEISGVELAERSSESALVRSTVTGDNPNREQLPLDEIRYTVTIEGHPPFSAVRSAQSTLPGFSTQSFDVPVALSSGDGPLPEGRVPYTIRGTVAYRLPGSIADLLFDNDIRKPTQPFGESGTLDFTGTVSRTPSAPEADDSTE